MTTQGTGRAAEPAPTADEILDRAESALHQARLGLIELGPELTATREHLDRCAETLRRLPQPDATSSDWRVQRYWDLVNLAETLAKAVRTLQEEAP